MARNPERRSSPRPAHFLAEIREILDRLRTFGRLPVESATPAERRRGFQLDLMRLHRVLVRHFGEGTDLVQETRALLRDSTAGPIAPPWTRHLHRLLNRVENRAKGETRAGFRRITQDLGNVD